MGKSSDGGIRAGRGWRGRRPLLLAFVLPALAISSFSTVHLISALGSAGSAARAGTLARLAADSTGLAVALEAERNEVVRFVALGGPADGTGIGRGSKRTSAAPYRAEQSVLDRAYAATDRAARQVTAAARGIGGSYPAAVRQQAASEVAAVRGLAGVRRASTTTDLPALGVISEYTSVIRAVLAVGSDAAPGPGEENVARSGQELMLIAGAREDVAQQSAILISVLNPDLATAGNFGSGQLSALNAAVSEQQAAQEAFTGIAGPEQRQQYQEAMSAPQVTRAQSMVGQAIATAQSGTQDVSIGQAGSALAYVGAGLGHVEAQLESAEQAAASTLHTRAVLTALACILLLVILAAMVFTVFRPRVPRIPSQAT